MPNLKLLDNIPVLHPDNSQKADKKRLKLEEVVEKFRQKIVAPGLRELSSESRIPPSQQNQMNPPEEHKRHISDLTSLIHHSRTESKPNQKEVQSMNYSLATAHKAPLINLDSGMKNDETGIFTFMYGKGIESSFPEAKDSLKEIINIQEEYINK